MGIDTPLQIAGLIAFIAFTAAIITAGVRYMLKSRALAFPIPVSVGLIVILLLSFTIAAGLSLLLFNALAYRDAYCLGRGCRRAVYSASQEPGLYWLWVALYYITAVAALSFGLVLGAKLFVGAKHTQSPSDGAESEAHKSEAHT